LVRFAGDSIATASADCGKEKRDNTALLLAEGLHKRAQAKVQRRVVLIRESKPS
jgi:hypothetical protein